MNQPRVKAHRTGVFETPVTLAQAEDATALAGALSGVIRARMAAHDGLKRSNAGGWHSDTQMTEWGGAPAARLSEIAVGVAQRMSGFEGAEAAHFDWTMSMWANVSRTGDFNNVHAHPGNVWAAVFHVDPGGEGSGSLYLEDPRFPMTAMRVPSLRMIGADGQQQRHQIDLKMAAGDLIVFPAWLKHGVRPHGGGGERITVAMNIDLREKRR